MYFKIIITFFIKTLKNKLKETILFEKRGKLNVAIKNRKGAIILKKSFYFYTYENLKNIGNIF